MSCGAVCHAVEKTRTSTRFPPQAPQACASTIPPRPHRDRGRRIADEFCRSNRRARSPKPSPGASSQGCCPTPRRWPPCRPAPPRSAPAGARAGLAGGASAAIHRRHLGGAMRSALPGTFPRPPGRARRAVDLSRSRPAHRLRDARPRPAARQVPARDVRGFVHGLEEWLIRALATFAVRGERREGRVGIWVVERTGGREAKIAAIGVRVARWVSFHGVALNVAPDLSHYDGIMPVRHQRAWRDQPAGAGRGRDTGRGGRGAARGMGRRVRLTLVRAPPRAYRR